MSRRRPTVYGGIPHRRSGRRVELQIRSAIGPQFCLRRSRNVHHNRDIVCHLNQSINQSIYFSPYTEKSIEWDRRHTNAAECLVHMH